jgi:UDP-N-acetylglucosamine 2-epimerase (non-hydrolysing)
VIAFGDVNSTLAAALVASKMQIRLAHVEAGLRSFDRSMPEEINRVLTDAVSDWLFTTEPSAEANLRREGVAAERIHFVGNTMIDTLLKHRAHALALDMPARLEVTPGRYVVVTLHRPSNVDDPTAFRRILSALVELASIVPVIFPVHPRTLLRLREWDLEGCVTAQPALKLMEPLGYLEFIGLMAHAGVVLTDSGGIQEETTILGIPCVTLRANTERPITLTAGTNVLVGNDPARMLTEALAALQGKRPASQGAPEKWDGQASRRIVDLLDEWMA